MKVCTVEGCENEQRARGWCSTHWRRWRLYGDPTTLVRAFAGDHCAAPECKKEPTDGRYCSAHRARLTRLGTFDLPTPSDRHVHSMGYQIVKRLGHPVATDPRGWVYEHRAVLFDTIGPGWHPCHRCGVQVSWELTYPENLDALVVDHLDEDRANNVRENLAPACGPCNFARSNRWVKQRRREASQ